MSKSVQIHDRDLIHAVEEGAEYLIIGERRFLLVEVQDDHGDETHNVTDPEEIGSIQKALSSTRPLLTGDEARAYVRSRLNRHGVR